MKKIFLVLLLWTLSGCMSIQPPVISYVTSPEISVETIKGIGDIFFRYEENATSRSFIGGDMNFGVNRFDLTIVELNEEKLALQYAEYTPNSTIVAGPYGPTRIPSPGWLIKQGFNKTYTYSVSDKFIRFKGYEFEIQSIENGILTYKRIK